MKYIWLTSIISLAAFSTASPALPSTPTTTYCGTFSATPAPSTEPCVLDTVDVVPKKINGNPIALYHFSKSWAVLLPLAQQHLSSVLQGLETTIPQYTKVVVKSTGSGLGPINLTVMLAVTVRDDFLGLAETDENHWSTCYVRITDDIPESAPSIEHITAHELYHCFQYQAMKTKLGTSYPMDWWFDGSAEFFANSIYPDTSQDSWLLKYDYTKPMYAQAKDGYAATLYFQYLFSVRKRTLVWIHNFVLAQKPNYNVDTSGPEAERHRMSGNKDIANDFPGFMQAIADRTIPFPSGGGPIPLETKIATTSIPITPLTANGAQQTISPDPILPFTGTLMELGFSECVTCTIDWDPPVKEVNTKAFYRKGTTGKWKALTTIKLKAQAGTVIQVLMTTTEDVVSTKPSLLITRTDRGNRKRQEDDGDSCPTSNCPYGSWSFTAALEVDGIKASTPGGITVSGIDVTGSATFTLDQDTKVATLQFEAFSASFDDTSPSSDGEDATVHYDLAIDGGGTATAVFAADGKSFKLTKPTYTGTFASETTYPEGDPSGPTGDFGVGFGPDVEVVFACDNVATDGDDHMSLNGLFGGAYIYDLYFEPDDNTA